MFGRNCALLVAGGLVLGFVGCVAIERSFIYQPTRVVDASPIPPDIHAEDISLRLPNSTPIQARWFPKEMTQGAILFCHGNAGNLIDRTNMVVQLREAAGQSVLIFDYPGYGRSKGEPSEESLYASADAAYDWLTQQKGVDPTQVIILGESLGGGVAVDLASRRPHRALILVKTFTSMPDMAQSMLPWLPRSLVSSRFDNLAKIASIQRPVLIVHGTADRTIPIIQAEKLYAAAHDPKQFVPLPNADHNDPLGPDFYQALTTFVNRLDGKAAHIGPPSY
jgi:fermentation-respiration switch protein FrsA (DUF1100 family)